MQIVTWNVNSVRSRKQRLLDWLAAHQPDVLCLQELKSTGEQFPHIEVRAAGYHAAVHGQKTYNGVAILARQPLTGVSTGFGDGEDDSHAGVTHGGTHQARLRASMSRTAISSAARSGCSSSSG